MEGIVKLSDGEDCYTTAVILPEVTPTQGGVERENGKYMHIHVIIVEPFSPEMRTPL